MDPPVVTGSIAHGRTIIASQQGFIYIAADNEYQCPAGERAIHRFKTVDTY
ncbi:hypothetical protein [Ottowia caeni]|uniref:hypothetical protein n=1 Tax=Ottowia caeni TaxID=2870339 RepID=UPI001E63BCE6|nr:hypothetical protein [Ottowia caeni]